MERRNFIFGAIAAGASPVAFADSFIFRPLVSCVPIIAADVSIEVDVDPATGELIRPAGQIAMIHSDAKWSSLPLFVDGQKWLDFGPEETASIFSIRNSDARKRWGDDVIDTVTKDGKSFPGWLFVCNLGNTSLMLWKKNDYYPSWLEPGHQTSKELVRWYDSRIDIAEVADEKGYQPKGVLAEPAKTFPQKPSTEAGKGLGTVRKPNSYSSPREARKANKASNKAGRTGWGFFAKPSKKCPPSG